MNILDKYRLPLFEAETELGSAGGEPAAPPPSVGTGGEKLSIRESLERGFEDARKAQEPAAPKKGAKDRAEDGKLKKVAAAEPARAADQMREATAPEEGAEPVAPAEGAAPAEGGEAQQQQPAAAAPAAWTKEAKEAWAALPPAVQQAVLKRETDVQKGVDELKGKYAELDQALAPHIPVIRQHGHTPAQAVQQLFAWFQALAANPDAAFPALAKSFNWQPKAPAQQPAAQAAPVAQPGATAPTAAPAAGEQPVGEIHPQLQQYINSIQQELTQLKQGFGQQLGTIQQTFAAQQQAKTDEILANWSKDKPHFEKVRGVMAQLIGSGAVPLKDGRVDLDGAYAKAVRLDDEVFTSIQQAETQAKAAQAVAAAAAKKKADETAAAEAKRAAASLTPNAPGAAPGSQGKKKKSSSVRESLLAAIDEVRAD